MIFEKIVEIIAEKTDRDPSEITRETLFSDLEIDSLDVAEMVMRLEDEFSISIELDGMQKTVGEFAEKVEKASAAKNKTE
ncbi:Acyl carrier protein [bioreactor metagenome]|uniref:Acyl carrier protein n=1 Tax=bioreactor metagenome TaxID=1076179 RepID=A0A644YQR8_9ZZZZ|nr:phosphopantetheine-binding protein [Oscillospiraceae bacterium]